MHSSHIFNIAVFVIHFQNLSIQTPPTILINIQTTGCCYRVHELSSIVAVDRRGSNPTMAPTTDVPVVRSYGGFYHDEVMASSASPSGETMRQSYFPSPYTRVTAAGRNGSRNTAIESPPTTRTIGNSGRIDDTQSSRRFRHSQPVGCVLPTIDSNVKKRHQFLSAAARDSSSEIVSGSSPRDVYGMMTARTTSSPPKKQPRTSTTTSSSQEKLVDAGRFPNGGHRDTVSGMFKQQHRPGLSGRIAAVAPGNVDEDDDDDVSEATLSKNAGSSLSSPYVAAVSSMTSGPRSILALYRCHDCSMENVRSYVDGLELDPVNRHRRHGHSRCSRLRPSAAASAVLLGLSLSPRSSVTELDETDVDQLRGSDAAGAASFVCRFDCRKCVHFEPIVRVFSDDDEVAEIRQLRSSSGRSTARWTTRGAGLLPPLQPIPSSVESTTTLSTSQAEDLPPVVQRYLIRCHGPQQQQQQRQQD